MSWGKKALDILRGIAPTAAAALAGPYAGPVMAILSGVLDVKPDKVEDYVLSASPDQLLQLKQAEIELERWREEAGIRKEELMVQDRQSARQMAIERGIYAQVILSAGYTFGYLLCVFIFVMGWARVDPQMTEMVTTLIGALGAIQVQVLNFWFGSSKGSKDKQDALIKAANGSG